MDDKGLERGGGGGGRPRSAEGRFDAGVGEGVDSPSPRAYVPSLLPTSLLAHMRRDSTDGVHCNKAGRAAEGRPRSYELQFFVWVHGSTQQSQRKYPPGMQQHVHCCVKAHIRSGLRQATVQWRP